MLKALPKSAQSAKAALAGIWNAEDREHAEKAARAFVADYGGHADPQVLTVPPGPASACGVITGHPPRGRMGNLLAARLLGGWG